MILDDAYKKQQSRYEFAAKYCSGTILDFTFASIMSYHGSKILLDNGANEIFTHDISNENHELSYRIYDSNKKINYSILDEKYEHEIKSIDCIIMSEIIMNDDFSKIRLDYFKKILKQNGVLIISSFNKNNKSLIFDQNTNKNYFSKNEFFNLLKNNFSKVELFSQKIISQKDITAKKLNSISKLKNKLRFALSTFYLKFDKKSNFYNKYMKNKNKTQELKTDEFEILPYSEKHNPLYFVAVCRKA